MKNRRGYKKKLVSMLMNVTLVLGIFIVLFPLSTPTAKADTLWYDDWTITDVDNITLYDDTIILNGTLLIEDGGKLTLDTCTLKTRYKSGLNNKIHVEKDGELRVLDNSLITIYSSPTTDRYEFKIEEDGKVLIENSIVEKMDDLAGMADGIQIYSDDVEIKNSTIRLGEGMGLYVKDGAVSITNSNIVNNDHYGICLSSGTSNNYIKGNSISNNGMTGIHIEDSLSTNNNIENNIIQSNGCNGIHIYESSGNIIIGNNISSNNEPGIKLYKSSHNNITTNSLLWNKGTHSGIWLRDDNDYNNIIGNTVLSNYGYGIYIKGGCEYNNINGNTISLNSLNGIRCLGSHNNIIGNNVTSNGLVYSWSGIYLGSSSYNNIIDNNVKLNGWYGIWLYSSSNNTITSNNILSNTLSGVHLFSSVDNKIGMNNISSNTDGINLTSSSDRNLITSNDLFYNTNYGFYFGSSDDNSIIDNTMTDNDYGASLDSSSDNNTLYHNNFKNDVYNASDSGTDNQWDNGLEGNWWAGWADNPAVTDTDGDGICEQSYSGASFTDNKPLFYEDNDRVLVDDPWFWFIQSGVNFADPGWTVYATPSTYLEDVTINKTLTVIGEDRNSTIIDARGSESVISIYSTSYVNVSGFTVLNATYGLRLNNSNYCVLEDNNAANNTYGIYLGSAGYPSNYNTVANNTVNNNTRGIGLYSSSHNTISDNTIELNNDEGIWVIENSTYNNIINNNILNNEFGVLVEYSSNIIIESNIISFNDLGIASHYSSSVIRYNNISYNELEGIGTLYYSNAIISNNTITHNYAGINKLFYSNGTIDNNIISYNNIGIHYGEFSSSIITYNNITFNINGIEGHGGSNATVKWNNIHNNTGYGVRNVDSTISINATYNYWGSPDEPQEGFDYEGLVDYYPWVPLPIEEAGPG